MANIADIEDIQVDTDVSVSQNQFEIPWRPNN
jgi:hypothetical protein